MHVCPKCKGTAFQGPGVRVFCVDCCALYYRADAIGRPDPNGPYLVAEDYQ